jgi:DNA-binding NarL/FixJ family response regulator
MRAVLRVDPPLLREVFEQSLKQSGIEVVANSSDFFSLLVGIKEWQPEVVFLTAPDADTPPSACSILLDEFPKLKIVVVSDDRYTITDVGVRVLHGTDLSFDSIHAALLKLLAD